MRPEEIDSIAKALGEPVVEVRTLASGFSHETCLLTLAEGQVVARLGGPDHLVEVAVMALARQHVPVPRVLATLPPADDDARPAMIMEYVAGTPLSQVLSADDAALGDLGAEVGRVVAAIGAVTFDRPGFFTDQNLAITEWPSAAGQLPDMVAACMDSVPEARLDQATRQAWMELCLAHAPSLARIGGHALVHADINPKNILVTRLPRGWQVDAILDWEFSCSGCPYADAANMIRFGADYPTRFVDGFRSGFGAHLPADLGPADDWAYLGRVLDMFALSDLVTRPTGHPIADQAAALIRRWTTEGMPDL